MVPLRLSLVPVLARITRGLLHDLLLPGLLLLALGPSLAAQGPGAVDCLACHDAPELVSSRGRSVAVKAGSLAGSVHAGMGCQDCHSQAGRYDEVPHFSSYQKVQCRDCHAEAAASFQGGFHDLAQSRGNTKAPGCVECHQRNNDPHGIQKVSPRTAEGACRQCHAQESARFDTSVHATALKRGQPSPGCTGCHATHTKAYPPSEGAVDLLCQKCHRDAMATLASSKHGAMGKESTILSCSSCHDVHATSRMSFGKDADKTCEQCHPGMAKQFEGSVHAGILAQGKMSCLSCHRTHQLVNGPEKDRFGCGACHAAEEKVYRKSAHRLARLQGDTQAASCGDCHGGHQILRASDPASSVSGKRLPGTCGRCHSDKQVFTSDYVRLPVSLASYSASVHGQGWKDGEAGAICTDCHGTHDLESAASASSTIHRANLTATCGKCHDQPARDYARSVHGRALVHGIKDSPSCTDCHDEHYILSARDPRSPVSRQGVGSSTCARCHENPAMAARYGLSPDVVKSFNDSYHGWAIIRGGEAVAVCADCHGAHAIGSSRDPAASIHPNHVVATCAKCHPGATPTFAASYTHVLARDRRMAHDWVRIAYLWIIALTLGGMALHNLVLYIHDLRIHYRHVAAGPSVPRMARRDIVQHVVLILAFTGLAVTGFALRFPEAWWTQTLAAMGLTEEIRRLLHRLFATLMVAASFYHLGEILFLRRGRSFFRDMLPGPRDLQDAVANLLYHARGGKGRHPEFDRFDYTQKAEYLALLWGTAVMAATGFILWFPALATIWIPAWMVRVAETIHYYEAILAVSAILIWHFFFVLVRPGVYPMSWIWITGRMPKEEWETHHGRAAKAEREADATVTEEPPEEQP